MTAPAVTRLGDLLAERGTGWPAPIHWREEVDSTNRWLKALALEGAATWTVALADRQRAGRGREGRPWRSPAGGLYVSVLLSAGPPLDAAQPGVLPLTAGVAVAQALQESGVRARLKWPNDVRVGGRKIAGLLAEMVPGARVVLGVGVNVAPLDAVWPEVRAERATSLEAEIGRGLDRLAVCAAVLARLAVCYDALATGGTAAMLDLWRALAEPWWGRPVEWRAGGRAGRGTARGVDGQGALIVEREDGLRESLLSGDVHELRLSGEASSA